MGSSRFSLVWIVPVLGVCACISKGDTTINAGPVAAGQAGSAGIGGSTGGTGGTGAAGASGEPSGGGGIGASGGTGGTGGATAGGAGGGGGSAGSAQGTCDTCSEQCGSCGDDSGCATPLNSKDNCGACGRKCTCDSIQAACTGTSLTPLAPADGGRTSVAIGGTWVYEQGNGIASRVDIGNPSKKATIVFPKGTNAWRGIATDAKYAYFALPDGVYRVSHADSPTPKPELIGTFTGAAPLATFSPIIVGDLMYFVTGAGTTQIDTLQVATLQLTGTPPTSIDLVPNVSATAGIPLNGFGPHLPTVAADASTNVYLCSPKVPGLHKAGQVIGSTDEACAGVAIVGGNVYYRGFNPNAPVSNPGNPSLSELGLTQLYKVPVGGPVVNPIGKPHHTYYGSHLVPKGDAALYYCGYDAPDTAPGLGDKYPFTLFRLNIGSNTVTRLAGGGVAWSGAPDCGDLAVDRLQPRVYMQLPAMYVLSVPDEP